MENTNLIDSGPIFGNYGIKHGFDIDNEAFFCILYFGNPSESCYKELKIIHGKTLLECVEISIGRVIFLEKAVDKCISTNLVFTKFLEPYEDFSMGLTEALEELKKMLEQVNIKFK